MCTYSQHIILSESDNAQVSWCKGCQGYSVIFNSCALSFSAFELGHFRNILKSLSERDFHYDFPGGRQVLIKNHGASLGICLTQKQVDNLEQLIAEAQTVVEAFKIIYHDNV